MRMGDTIIGQGNSRGFASLGTDGCGYCVPGYRTSTRGDRLNISAPPRSSTGSSAGRSDASGARTTSVSPSTIAWPGTTRTRCTCPPSTRTPFAELRSTTSMPPAPTSMRAWRLDTSGSASTTSTPGPPRPTTVWPDRSSTRRPASGPERTSSSAAGAVEADDRARAVSATTAALKPDPIGASPMRDVGGQHDRLRRGGRRDRERQPARRHGQPGCRRVVLRRWRPRRRRRWRWHPR